MLPLQSPSKLQTLKIPSSSICKGHINCDTVNMSDAYGKDCDWRNNVRFGDDQTSAMNSLYNYLMFIGSIKILKLK